MILTCFLLDKKCFGTNFCRFIESFVDGGKKGIKKPQQEFLVFRRDYLFFTPRVNGNGARPEDVSMWMLEFVITGKECKSKRKFQKLHVNKLSWQFWAGIAGPGSASALLISVGLCPVHTQHLCPLSVCVWQKRLAQSRMFVPSYQWLNVSRYCMCVALHLYKHSLPVPGSF